MPELKPAYLIHGEDHGAVAERRAGLRALAEQQGSAASVEVLAGESASPAGVAQALAAMTLTVGRRVIIVEGVERWREADVIASLAPALARMPPETTLAMFAREEARAKAPAALAEAVKAAGGQIVAQPTVRPWELAGWVREQAARLGLQLDGAAAKALIAQVGERQQRLLRELEKLALEGEEPAADPDSGAARARPIGAQEIERLAARSAQWRAYELADALLGADPRAALGTYLRLREQGERPAGLTYLMASRLREALAISLALAQGRPAAEIKRGLRMPARAAERLLSDVARSDPARLRAALGVLAALEVDTRGGAPVRSARTPLSSMSEDTILVRSIESIADGQPPR